MNFSLISSPLSSQAQVHSSEASETVGEGRGGGAFPHFQPHWEEKESADIDLAVFHLSNGGFVAPAASDPFHDDRSLEEQKEGDGGKEKANLSALPMSSSRSSLPLRPPVGPTVRFKRPGLLSSSQSLGHSHLDVQHGHLGSCRSINKSPEKETTVRPERTVGVIPDASVCQLSNAFPRSAFSVVVGPCTASRDSHEDYQTSYTPPEACEYAPALCEERIERAPQRNFDPTTASHGWQPSRANEAADSITNHMHNANVPRQLAASVASASWESSFAWSDEGSVDPDLHDDEGETNCDSEGGLAPVSPPLSIASGNSASHREHAASHHNAPQASASKARHKSTDATKSKDRRRTKAAKIGRRKQNTTTFWSKDERTRFVDGLKRFGNVNGDSLGKGVAELISTFVGTRTVQQVRSHAQKFFLRQKQNR